MRLAQTKERIKNLTQRLDNPSYINKAPKHLVEETGKELFEQSELAKRLSKELKALS
jgi:valyl-tRNA synthetase